MALNAEINVVSLIDVMLLLLVVFMITAPLMQGGVDVALPRAQARPLEQRSGLVVTVNLRMRDVKRSAVLFQQNGVQEQADFRVLGQVSQTISREETALRSAATEIGRAIVALAVTRF